MDAEENQESNRSGSFFLEPQANPNGVHPDPRASLSFLVEGEGNETPQPTSHHETTFTSRTRKESNFSRILQSA